MLGLEQIRCWVEVQWKGCEGGEPGEEKENGVKSSGYQQKRVQLLCLSTLSTPYLKDNRKVHSIKWKGLFDRKSNQQTPGPPRSVLLPDPPESLCLLHSRAASNPFWKRQAKGHDTLALKLLPDSFIFLKHSFLWWQEDTLIWMFQRKKICLLRSLCFKDSLQLFQQGQKECIWLWVPRVPSIENLLC